MAEQEEDNLETRIKALENKLEDIDVKKDIYEGSHRKFLNYITVIFGIAAFFFTAAAVVMGFFSFRTSSDINEAISNMQNTTNDLSKQVYAQLNTFQSEVYGMKSDALANSEKVSDKLNSSYEILSDKMNSTTELAVADMKKEFEEIKNKPPKQVKINIKYEGEIVTGGTITIKATSSDSQTVTYILNNIEIINDGDAIAYVTSVELTSRKSSFRAAGGDWISSDPQNLPITVRWEGGNSTLVAALNPMQSVRTDLLTLTSASDYIEAEIVVYSEPAPTKLKINFLK